MIVVHLHSAHICIFLKLGNKFLKDGKQKSKEGKDKPKQKPHINHLDVGRLGHSKIRLEKRLEQLT